MGIFKKNQYLINCTEGHSYFAYVHDKTAEWHILGIDKVGTYEISCENDKLSYIEKDPPKDPLKEKGRMGKPGDEENNTQEKDLIVA